MEFLRAFETEEEKKNKEEVLLRKSNTVIVAKAGHDRSEYWALADNDKFEKKRASCTYDDSSAS